jgi:hypothetical protein
MKGIFYATMLTLMANLALRAEPPAPAITIPPGVIAASQAQKEFISKLATLPVGASKTDVVTALGSPADQNAAKWSYQINEDQEGGYYLRADLTFGINGLTGGGVSYGHITISRKDE